MDKEIKIGNYFNGLLILRIFRKKANSEKHFRDYVEFKCPCGKIHESRKSKVQIGLVKSCGCRLARNKFPKSTPLVNKVDCLSSYFNTIINDANKRGIDFTLSKKEFKNIVTQKCTYCNSTGTRLIKFNGKEEIFIGLDRIDNSKGYIKNNVCSCCSKCNMSKGKLTKEEFLKHIEQIYKFQNQ